MQVLTIEDLHVLQFNAISLLVNVFQEYPDQRKVLVESFISSILFNAPMVSFTSTSYLLGSQLSEVFIYLLLMAELYFNN